MLAMTEHPERLLQTQPQLPPTTPNIALLDAALGNDNPPAIARLQRTFRLALHRGLLPRHRGLRRP